MRACTGPCQQGRKHCPPCPDACEVCDAESAQAVFKELDALDYGMAWWLCIVVLATLAAIVMVATA